MPTKALYPFALLVLGTAYPSFGQYESELITIKLEHNRLHLTDVIRVVHNAKPKLICLNVTLECVEDEIDQGLQNELESLNTILMPSELLPFGTGKFRDIVGCSYLIPHKAVTGFTNFIFDKRDRTLVEKVPVRYVSQGDTVFHLAFLIARSLDTARADKFSRINGDTAPIKMSQNGRFQTLDYSEITEKDFDSSVFNQKVVMVYFSSGEQNRVRSRGRVRRQTLTMAQSEIIANIAYEMIDK